jgi:predicted RNA-binding protein with RPS1 domain
MQDKIGESFEGRVSSVTGCGIFVALDDIYVEGLVHITDLGKDYFHFDAAKHHLLGERTGQRFRLGDRVRVKVVRVDLESAKIDFQFDPLQRSCRGRKKPARKRGGKAEGSHDERRLIYGFHAVISRIRHSPQGVTELYLERERQDGRMQDLLRLAGENNIRVILAERHRLDNMSGHARHQGVVAVIAALPQYQDIHDVLEKLTDRRCCWRSAACRTATRRLPAVADAMGACRDGPRTVPSASTPRCGTPPARRNRAFITVTNLSRTLRDLQDENIWRWAYQRSRAGTAYPRSTASWSGCSPKAKGCAA